MHADLALDAVTRKVVLEDVGQREDPNVERDHGDNEDPVKTVKQFKVWITILNKTSVGVQDKNTPADSHQLPINRRKYYFEVVL